MQNKTMSAFLGLILAQTFSSGALAAYKEVASCGTANVVAGDTCSNVKVEFKFDGCSDVKGTELAKKIVCVGEVISARYQVGDVRYQALYEKMKDAKGKVTWKPLGGVKRLVKSTVEANAPVKSESVASAVAAVAAMTPATEPQQAAEKTESKTAPGGHAPASPFKFGGFADLRYTSFTTTNDPSIASGNPASGFGIEDGAVYLNYEKENMSIVADLAFRRNKDSDTNAAATQPNQSSSSAIAFGVDKSQLYLRYKMGSMFALSLGQFDTMFGVEVNDSKDRLFNKTGTTYDLALPVTHTGAMLEFTKGGFGLKAFAANPNNKASNGSSATGDDKTEYGMAIGYSNDSIHGQIGYMGRPINQASGAATGTRSLTDVTAGVSLGAFAFDAEYARVSDPSKNTLTPLDNTDLESAGEACLGMLSYKFSEAFLMGVRYETVNGDPSSGAIGGSVITPLQSANSTGVVIHYKVNPELELRSEYIGYNGTGVGGNTWTDSRFDAGAIVSF